MMKYFFNKDTLFSTLFIFIIAYIIGLLVISSHILDSTLGTFIAILLGSIGAFLYFNIYPARIWLGDVGSLSLGAVLAVIDSGDVNRAADRGDHFELSRDSEEEPRYVVPGNLWPQGGIMIIPRPTKMEG